MNTVVDTALIQALDREHFLHPFTDFKDLATRGARVITKAENIYVWDSEGHKILDAMSGLWCVNVGYGREELASAAYRQMMTLPFYNSFFQTTNVPAVQLAAKLAALAPEVGGRSFQACVLFAAAAPRATTRMCAWCAATGTCWASRSAKSSSAATTPTTAAPWPGRRWAA